MLKSRISQWVCSVLYLVIVLGIKGIFIESKIPDKYISIAEITPGDSFGINKLNNVELKNKLKVSYYKNDLTKSPDMIIKLSDNESIEENYTKESNMFSIPIVLYFRSNMYENSSGFNTNLGSTTSKSAVFKDLNVILSAMLENKSWADIEISKYVAKGPIKLYIPSKSNFWYDVVIEQFYYTLNENKIPNDAEREALKPKVDKILQSCVEVEDMSQAIADLYEKNDKSKVFIGPENIISNFYNRNEMFSLSSSSYSPCYIKNTLGVYFDLYVRKVVDDNDRSIQADVKKSNEDSIKAALLSNCFKYTGIRAKNDVVGKFKDKCMDEINIIPYTK